MRNRFIQRAPENFLSAEQISQIKAGRRGFLASAFSVAAAAAASVTQTGTTLFWAVPMT
jgi:sulfane dehydrogenase subunit SoxC